MKDIIQSNSGVTHKNGVKGDHAGRKHKGVKEGINAPSQQTIVQPKLELTTPGDSYEREADRMADFVMRKAYSGLPTEMPSSSSVLPPMISRCASSSTSGVAVDKATESGIHASRGGGQPMPTALRSQMESGFEADFSGVRLHTGSAAEAMSNDLRAKSFTYGNDIYFNRGQYSPDTTAGQHLIAHELTHVVQQSGKVGRIPIDGCYHPNFTEEQRLKERLNEAESRMKKFILEPQWIKEKVLGNDLFEKLKRNYFKEKEGAQKPVVIVVLTSHAAACQGNNSTKCAFEEVEPGILWDTIEGPISSLLENSGDKRVLMIQAPRSNQDLINKIKKITSDYGPIKDIIFRGHGNRNKIALNKGVETDLSCNPHYSIKTSNLYSHSNSINNASLAYPSELISTIVDNMDKNRPNTIIFAGCLTDADSNTSSGLSQSVRNYLKTFHPNSNIDVQGNEAPVSTKDVTLSYEEGKLKLGNKGAPSAPNSTGDLRDYKGCKSDGILWNMIGKLDPNTQNLYDDASRFEYCESDHLQNIKITRNITDASGKTVKIKLVIETNSLINFVKNNIQGYETPSISRRDMLIFLRRIAENPDAIFRESVGTFPITDNEIRIKYRELQQLYYNRTMNSITGSNNNRTQR